MELEMRTESVTLLLDCSEPFQDAGHAVLKKLAELNDQGPPLKHGSKVQFGWTVLSLRSEIRDLRVWEPDYLGDALHDLHRNLDLTLEVTAEQVAILRREKVEGLDARYDDYVLAWPGALLARNVFLRRQRSETPENTGWFIGDLDRIEEPHAEEDTEPLRVFEVLQRRRTLMKLLALPPGYAATMKGDEIDSIMRPQ